MAIVPLRLAASFPKRYPITNGGIGHNPAEIEYDDALIAWSDHLSGAAAARHTANPAFFPQVPGSGVLERLAQELGLDKSTLGLARARLEAYRWISTNTCQKKAHERIARHRGIPKERARFWASVSQLVMAYLEWYWAEHPKSKELGPALPVEDSTHPATVQSK